MNHKMGKRLISGLLIALTLATCFAPQTLAQFSQNNKRQPKPEYQVKEMDREMSLPNVPAFTGKQVFIEGMSYPTDSYHLNYSTENPNSEVLDWWKTALNAGYWKVTYSNATCVRAQSKDLSTCSVIITGPSASPKAKRMRGGYSIYYSPPQKVQ